MGSQRKCPVDTGDAPAAIGPYSQAVAAGGWLFCSGQLGLDPTTGELVTGGIEEQGRRAMANLGAVLEAAGLAFEDLTKLTVYITDMSGFAAFNEVYAEFLSQPWPARAVVGAAALPKGALVEIEGVALLRD